MQFVRSCATYVGFSIAPSLTCTYAPALLPLHYISASTAGKTQPFHPLLNRTLTGCLQSTYLTKRNNAKALLFSQADDWTSCLFFLITAKPKKKKKSGNIIRIVNVSYLHLVSSEVTFLCRTLSREASLASMDLRKWVWSICAAVGLVLCVSECE